MLKTSLRLEISFQITTFVSELITNNNINFNDYDGFL